MVSSWIWSGELKSEEDFVGSWCLQKHRRRAHQLQRGTQAGERQLIPGCFDAMCCVFYLQPTHMRKICKSNAALQSRRSRIDHLLWRSDNDLVDCLCERVPRFLQGVNHSMFQARIKKERTRARVVCLRGVLTKAWSSGTFRGQVEPTAIRVRPEGPAPPAAP